MGDNVPISGGYLSLQPNLAKQCRDDSITFHSTMVETATQLWNNTTFRPFSTNIFFTRVSETRTT
jgi:hypothetical protein